MTDRRFAYLHGFASSSASLKGTAFKEAFAARGLSFGTPDLNVPSFSALSPQAMIDHLDGLHASGDGPWSFVGSSLGGWLAARWAELHPERVARLVLLCPAFDIGERWPAILGEGVVERWKKDGTLPMPDGRGKMTRLHYAFFEDSARMVRRPSSPVPTLVIHGRGDDRVPIESSRRWVREQPDARLVEVDDGHSLVDSIETVIGEGLPFLLADR